MIIQKIRASERNIWLRLMETIEKSRYKAMNKGKKETQMLFPLK